MEVNYVKECRICFNLTRDNKVKTKGAKEIRTICSRFLSMKRGVVLCLMKNFEYEKKVVANKVTLRITKGMLDGIDALANDLNTDRSKVISKMIALSNYKDQEIKKFVSSAYSNASLLGIRGQKNKSSAKTPISDLLHSFECEAENKTESKEKLTIIETCGGGLGLLPVKYMDHPEWCNWIISDIEQEKTHLYAKVLETPHKLAELSIKVYKYYIEQNNPILFDTNKDASYIKIVNDAITCDSPYDDSIIKAVAKMIKYSTSSYNYDQKKHIVQLPRRVENLMKIHWLLTSCNQVKIENKDMLELISENKNKKNTLILIDPPYLYAPGGKYEHNVTDKNFHDNLYTLLTKCKCKIALFGRITASKEQGDHNNRLIDEQLKSFYNNRYMSYPNTEPKFYYRTYKLTNRRIATIELILTNFPAAGFKPYNKPIE